VSKKETRILVTSELVGLGKDVVRCVLFPLCNAVRKWGIISPLIGVIMALQSLTNAVNKNAAMQQDRQASTPRSTPVGVALCSSDDRLIRWTYSLDTETYRTIEH
jgi:hypothetical protein